MIDTMKILLVDDDTFFLQDIKEILESNGHAVISANDGRSTISIFKLNNDIDLVITDFNMPNGNGLVVIKGIKEIQLEARIWLVSNVMNDEIGNEAKKLDAEKSVHKSNLIRELQKEGIIKK